MGRYDQSVWGVVLAGGDGTRLQGLTTRIEGDSRPKQFCRMLGDETLLTQTRQRISELIDERNIVTVVTRKHEPYFSGELGIWPRARILVQPENRGTGVAIGAAVLMLSELDPEAIVAAFPSDHHYSNESALLDVIQVGVQAARADCDAIILVGAEATYPETEYGWIEPVENRAGFTPTGVRRFWEKPHLITAESLLRAGACGTPLWPSDGPLPSSTSSTRKRQTK